MWPYSVWCVCFSACVTAPGLWTALQGLEYGSSPHQQALTEAVRRCVFICVCVCVCLSACHLSCVFMCIIYVSSECILVCLLHFFFLFSSLCSTYRLVKAVCITPLFRYSLNIDNDMCGWPACPLSQSVWCFRWSLCLFPLCRRLSEEAPGGRRVRWQRLHQKDERWLWPSTHLFQRITVCSDDLNPPPLPLLTYETLQRSSEGVRIQKIKADSYLPYMFRGVVSECRHSRTIIHLCLLLTWQCWVWIILISQWSLNSTHGEADTMFFVCSCEDKCRCSERAASEERQSKPAAQKVRWWFDRVHSLITKQLIHLWNRTEMSSTSTHKAKLHELTTVVC